MIIAIDWDGTFTRAALLLKSFCRDAKELGYEVIIVTGRLEDAPITPPPEVKKVIYCGDSYKAEVVKKHGIKVDIWIDNEPGHIEPPRKLFWQDENT